MSLIGRATRRIGRELKKHSRLRQASREGLVFVEPTFSYRPDLSVDAVVIDAGCSHEADFSVCLIRRHGVRAFGVDPTRENTRRPCVRLRRSSLVGSSTCRVRLPRPMGR